MRILSKFKDYYDSLSNLGGHDDSIIYHRVEEEFNNVKFPGFFPFNKNDSQEIITVIFCGEIHFCIHIFEKKIFDKGTNKWVVSDEIFEWDNIKEWEDCWWGKHDKKDVESNIKYSQRHRWWRFKSFDDFKRLYERDFTEYNLRYKSPILLFRDSRSLPRDYMIKNPKLQDFQFAKAVDPYTAFQKLENFVDTHFTRKVDMTEVSDDDRYFMKGFDKWSFRKEPWKKKGKRK